ncbi:MAG: hypothetical protein DRN05_06285 [Thermoplasmata archaeon]|nr:MAG: hypothetical protein DRN05_06285 [Thermoplasmata archaeon]
MVITHVGVHKERIGGDFVLHRHGRGCILGDGDGGVVPEYSVYRDRDVAGGADTHAVAKNDRIDQIQRLVEGLPIGGINAAAVAAKVAGDGVVRQVGRSAKGVQRAAVLEGLVIGNDVVVNRRVAALKAQPAAPVGSVGGKLVSVNRGVAQQ